MPIPRFSTGGIGTGGNVNITVVTDFSNIRRSMATLKRKIGSAREPLKKCALDYMSRKIIRQRFVAQGQPKWKKHAKSTVARLGKHSILNLTGALKESVTGGKNFFLQFYPGTRPDTVMFGSTLPYAGVHDQPRGTYTRAGRGNIPGRPWSEIKQKNINDMRDIFMSWANKKLRESGFRGR